jgi:23S rRNA (guanosine2251-2'-O)-methyltransferase
LKKKAEAEIIIGFKNVETIIQKVGFGAGDKLYFSMEGGRLEKLLRKARKSRDVQVKRVNHKSLFDLTGHKEHGGLVLIKNKGLSQFSEIREQDVYNLEGIVVALDSLNDPQNLGAIIRSCVAFGVKAIVLPRRQTPPLNDTVLRVSRGALCQIPVCFIGGLSGFLERIKKNNPDVLVVGAAIRGEPLQKFLVEKPANDLLTLLCLGSEDSALSPLASQRCDRLLSIEQGENVESLNVAAAASILLYSLQTG